MYLAESRKWYLERAIWLVAGVFVLAATTLSVVHSPYWLILNALVGINLVIFAATGFCIMANLLVRLGLRPFCASEGGR